MFEWHKIAFQSDTGPERCLSGRGAVKKQNRKENTNG